METGNQHTWRQLNFSLLARLPGYDIHSQLRASGLVQCFSWVGTAFPQIFPCVLIFVNVEITPPVHYAASYLIFAQILSYTWWTIDSTTCQRWRCLLTIEHKTKVRCSHKYFFPTKALGLCILSLLLFLIRRVARRIRILWSVCLSIHPSVHLPIYLENGKT
jgi:hypothetical protein